MLRVTSWAQIDSALRRYFARRVADQHVQADLVQDVLLRIHERRAQLRDDDRLDAWVSRIARNALIDHYRHDHARPRHEALLEERLEDRLEERVETAPDARLEGGASSNGQLLGGWLRGRLDSLPEPQRRALELTELEGLSQREAADQLGVPYSTFKSRVQRGRDRLHAELVACCAVEVDARGGVLDFQPRKGPCGC